MMTIAELEQEAIPEVAAVILVCRAFLKTATADEIAAFFDGRKINWDLFAQIVRAHHIRPVVNKVFAEVKINEGISGRLQSDCMQITLSNFEQYRELLRLNELFRQAGITAVPYKGCLFSLQFYNDINLREFSDIDFLINPDIKDVDAVTRVMLAAGYNIGYEAPEQFREFYFSNIREFKYRLQVQDRRHFLAEFHSLLNDPVFDTTKPVTNDYLFADLQEATLSGNAIKVLSPTKHVIAMLTHHGIREQWTSFKNVMDLAVAIQNGSTVDWDVVFDSATQYRYLKVLTNGLGMVEALFGISIRRPYKKALIKPWLRHLLSKHLPTTDRTWRYNFSLKLKAKDNAADKWRMLYNHLRYLGTPSILDYKFIRLPRPLFFLYVIIKPFRMIFG